MPDLADGRLDYSETGRMREREGRIDQTEADAARAKEW